ncbi:conserved exported hypothetical protein [Bradyrhizobium oligotrophicum S58]|uniref:Uncharacterized protein n=1 Tax=Bradyrhizobium oligotrophicum S58 TaxID=1245469 RepID=M4Z8Z2_9BRAD|nr:hypothetical protein [Bradyrhizobium oligotrophicum]BAM90158.1 conserved exported hypothetical protein [Bradyrhizobium oligotrophicum S58]
MASRTAGVAFAIATGFLGTVVVLLPRVVIAAEECLTEPTGEKSDAQRWYYRFDRGTNRRCWYLKDANGGTRDTAALARSTQQPAPWDFAQPAPPKLTPRRADGPAPRAAADAMAEAPQPRLRTDLAVRGTPKPQNVAVTPTTLTASDASLSRGLDASSPWPSSPPPQPETTASDTAPAAMADDGNADADANPASTGDGQGAAPSKTTKPEAPIHVLMLVVIGALAISGLLASALYRLSRMGRRRRRNGSWHGDATQIRRARTKPRAKAPPPPALRAGRGSMPPAPSHVASSRGAQPASALDLASARLSASQPEHAETRAYRQAQSQAPSPQHQDHPAVAARRRDHDAAAEMPRTQATDAVWQAVDQLSDRAAVRRAAPADQMIAADVQPSPATPSAPAPAAPTAQQQQQMAAAQMAAAQAAAAKIAAAKVAAAKANAAAAPAARQAPSNHAAATEPQQAQAWPATQRPAAANPAPASMAAPPPPPVPPTQDAAAAAPPAPVDVGEIVSALRKARASDATSAAGGGAPIDAAKVIAALLVSRAAKRQTAQPATTESGDAAAAVVPSPAASPPATEPTASQAAQQLMNRLRGGQLDAQPTRVTSNQPTAASADPAAALVEALRAHAARQPAYPADDQTAATEAAAMSKAPTAADDDELDDPAAALINLLQSRFSLPEDELDAEPFDDEHEESSAEAPQIVGSMHDDPTAQLMSLLESRSSIPAAPPVLDRPQPQHQQQPQQRRQPQQQQYQQQPQRPPQQQQYQQPPQRPQQQRSPFVPSQFEDPATPPLDFIPRPQALRPRPHSIQHDESLDGIQDILARLGRRA